MKKLFFFILFFSFNFLSAASPEIKSFTKQNPKQILMVGNSFLYYNNGMHNPLVRMIRADKELGEGQKKRKRSPEGSASRYQPSQ